MMYSVTDMAGLNRISRHVLGNAAHAMRVKWDLNLSHSSGICGRVPPFLCSRLAHLPSIGLPPRRVT
jgi:hypothetical protein